MLSSLMCLLWSFTKQLSPCGPSVLPQPPECCNQSSSIHDHWKQCLPQSLTQWLTWNGGEGDTQETEGVGKNGVYSCGEEGGPVWYTHLQQLLLDSHQQNTLDRWFDFLIKSIYNFYRITLHLWMISPKLFSFFLVWIHDSSTNILRCQESKQKR